MDRLTECVGYHNDKPIYMTKIDMRKIGSVDILKNKLGNYEDAEEQGLLLKLPCKVGDTVYSVVADGRQIIELRFCLEFYVVRKNDFGKTVFLTREEAEKALADMGV